MAFIEARELVKTYRPRGAAVVHALDGLSIEVPQGTVQALLGPNGAGKTTTVKVLTTLINPDSGSATIDGIDVLNDGHRIRPMIGVSGQYAAVDENLTGFENLDMVGRLYHLGARASRARAKELIGQFDLIEAQNRPVKGFSGGMRRRIDLAGALVTRPKVLFLDEPTTGLDPRSRLGMWDIITSLVGEGTTVLLTTQYLEEADRLADSISVIDGGKGDRRGNGRSPQGVDRRPAGGVEPRFRRQPGCRAHDPRQARQRRPGGIGRRALAHRLGGGRPGRTAGRAR